MADSHKNFAISEVATAPSPATSGTSLVVTSGHGTRFPAVPFNAILCPVNVTPTPANAEVVRVTGISTDTFTIVRTQESSSARTVIVGDVIFAGPTAKSFTDVELPLHFTWAFNPKAVCDGTIDRLFLMLVGPDFPNGIKITRWNLSFDADPATEADLDFKRADAFIGVANSAVVDVLDTTAGVSSETTAASINADAAVANGKVLYLEFGTAYTVDNLQIIFEFWGYPV